MLNLGLAVGFAALSATAAFASTPQSWADMNRRAARACVAMAGLSRPQLLAQRISFSDAIPVEARLIRGMDRKGRMQRLLCLYDRRTRTAEVQPAPTWNSATTQP